MSIHSTQVPAQVQLHVAKRLRTKHQFIVMRFELCADVCGRFWMAPGPDSKSRQVLDVFCPSLLGEHSSPSDTSPNQDPNRWMDEDARVHPWRFRAVTKPSRGRFAQPWVNLAKVRRRAWVIR